MTTSIREELAVRAWAALATVVDPELGEPITDLGFVTALSVLPRSVLPSGAGGQEVHVLLRLPTYFCAPNFAYLMVADAHDAILGLEDVDSVKVELQDHFASEEINAGVAASNGFTDAFPGEATSELNDLRLTFQRKTHLACLERTCRRLIAAGWQIDALADTKLADVPPSHEFDSLMRRRAELGLPTAPESPLFVEEDGEGVSAEQLPARLRFAKAVRISIDGNAGLCRGLLKTRYDRMAKEGRS
jgi:metal-sulfur cluster biosynthetic enzyme